MVSILEGIFKGYILKILGSRIVREKQIPIHSTLTLGNLYFYYFYLMYLGFFKIRIFVLHVLCVCYVIYIYWK